MSLTKLSQLFFKKGQNTQGYTIVEILATQILVGILASVSLPNYQNHIDKARQSEGMSHIGTMNRLQQSYYFEHGKFAQNLDELGIAEDSNHFVYTVEVTDNQVLHQGSFANREDLNLIGGLCVNEETKSFTTLPPQPEDSQTTIVNCVATNSSNNSQNSGNNNQQSSNNQNSGNNNQQSNNTQNSGNNNQQLNNSQNSGNNNQQSNNNQNSANNNQQSNNNQNNPNNNSKKVTICHKGKTISVASPAVSALVSNGASLGACK